MYDGPRTHVAVLATHCGKEGKGARPLVYVVFIIVVVVVVVFCNRIRYLLESPSLISWVNTVAL